MLVKVQGTSEQVIAIAAKAEGPKGVGDVTHEMSANTPILTFPPIPLQKKELSSTTSI